MAKTMVKRSVTGVEKGPRVVPLASLTGPAMFASISILVLGCGLLCTFNEGCVDLSPEYVYAGACISVLSFVPVVLKWL